MRKRNVVAALGACLAAAILLSPTASADPSAPTNRLLAGMGSDTTENVMNDFANGRTAIPAVAGNSRLASWNTLPLNQVVTTKAPIAGSTCEIPRAFGSGAGVTRLVTEQNAAAATTPPRRSCIDFARSSSGPSGAGTDLHWVPFAVDALSYGTNGYSAIPRNLTRDQLRAVYLCQVPNILPLLPQPGSGTRSAWLGFLGLDNTTDIIPRIAAAGSPHQAGPANPRCISENVVNSAGIITTTPLTESVGNVTTNAQNLLPYSAGVIRAQEAGVVANENGAVAVRSINSVSPEIDNPAFPFRRLLFNVVPTQFVGNADYVASFGTASSLCTNDSVLFRQGFAPVRSGDPLLAPFGASGCGDLASPGLRARTLTGLAGPPST